MTSLQERIETLEKQLHEIREFCGMNREEYSENTALFIARSGQSPPTDDVREQWIEGSRTQGACADPPVKKKSGRPRKEVLDLLEDLKMEC